VTAADDLALLRRHEPILRFTRGEIFFPSAVGPYVRRCSLWSRSRQGTVECLVPAGELDLDRLAAEGPPLPGETRFLHFIEEEPISGDIFGEWRAHLRREFRAPGRLARVGLLARFVDGLFSLSLMLRGTVPGGTTARAAAQYREMVEEAPGFPYYARVVRDPHYVVLQYLFFYAMNDWRSSFSGVNDHEADWEQVFVYLEEVSPGDLRPAWVAYAAHSAGGDDLRRRWDDPELTIEDGHPVVYAAAGSHAAYFRPGEYLVAVQLRFLQPFFRVLRTLRFLWNTVTRQGSSYGWTERVESFLRIPFVDYARGDGASIGPGQADEWQPVPIDGRVGWVRNYRGLWGLDVQDVFAGELAPAGPRYARDGSVRETWRDPVGWSGLRKVAPDSDSEKMLDERIRAVEEEVAAIDSRIAELDHALPMMELELRALDSAGHLRPAREERRVAIAALEEERSAAGRRRSALRETLEALRRFAAAPVAERRGDPRAHIRRPHEPETPAETRRNVAAEIWAALSTGLLLIGGVALLLLGIDDLVFALGVLVAAVVVVESLFHGRIVDLLLNVVLGLAVATGLVLVYEFFWQITLGTVAAIAVLIVVENLRELRGR
jgi:hypothetical protein